LQVLLTTYQVRSAPQDAPTIQGRLQDAAANANAGLYAALQANGVPLRPTFSFTGIKGAGGSSGGGSGGGGGLSTGAIAGIAVGAAVGGLLLLAGIVYLVLRRRKSKPNPAYEANKGKAPAAAPVEVAAEEGAVPGGKAAGAAPAAVSDANGAGQPRDA
jgi:hypothetical protein